MVYAEKLLPHSVEAEEAVIGSLLLDGTILAKVVSTLHLEDFYHSRTRCCYETCLLLFERGEPINQISVAHTLESTDKIETIGGHAYLSHLIATVPTPVYVEHYAQIVNRTATLRRLIQAAGEITALGYDGGNNIEEVLGKAENLLFRVRDHQPSQGFVSLREVLDQYLEESATASQAKEDNEKPTLTGFEALDELLGGLQRSDMVILAARPSLGKSSLALNITLNAARQTNAIVGVFSLEMSREQLAIRLLSSESGVDTHRLRLGLYTESEEQRIVDAVGTLSELSIYIDDSPFQSVLEMRGKARRLKLEHGVDLIVADYLQLIQGSTRSSKDNRVQEISEISRSLKGLARDLNVPLLAVSQLSRAVEMRPSHRPQLSDLRESGSIEQDADIVTFIYREDMYFTPDEWEQRYPEKPYPKNIAEIIVAKHRHGPLGSVQLYFQNKLARFEDLRLPVGGRP